MIKAVKVLNRISTILFVIVLLTTYAYLPISVNINIEEIGDLHKQSFFYYGVVAFISVNLLIRVILHFGIKTLSENFQAWITSLICIFNMYLSFLIVYIGVWNNQGHINPSIFSTFTLFGPILMIIWIFGVIFLFVKKSRTT
jgi:hypothetical protein